MTIEQLRAKYTEKDLSNFLGDKALRYAMFAPLFENLFEQKVIYHEKIMGIVKLKDVIITPDSFTATAVPHLCINRRNDFDDLFFQLEDWTFSAGWDWMLMSDDGSIGVPYAGWTIWTDPILVERVERLCEEKKYDEAFKLFLY